MKTLVTILLLAALPAFAQLTNSVKVSSLPSATTPLTGTEIIPLNQSGSTKSATVDQVQAKAVGIANATSNSLTTSLGALNTNLVTVSNLLSLRIVTNTTALTTTSNALQSQITSNSAAIITASNSILGTVASAGYATASALAATNSVLVATIGNVAAGIGNTLTNGGALTYSTLTGSVLDLGKMTNSSSVNVTLDMRAASYQKLTVTNNNSVTRNMQLYLTNAASGQNVSFLISCQSAYSPGMAVTVISSGLKSYNSAGVTNFTFNNGKTALVEFNVFDPSNILFSASVQP